MKAIITCILLMLGCQLALAATPPVLILQSAKQICCDENYVKILELAVKEDGTTPKLSSKYEVLKEYPQDMTCGVEFFKKEGEEYKKIPLDFPTDNCCKMMSNEMMVKAMEKQNVPKSCPVKPGKYELTDYFVPPEKLSEESDRGEYKVEFKMNLSSGSCVYGQETYFKIVDKQ